MGERYKIFFDVQRQKLVGFEAIVSDFQDIILPDEKQRLEDKYTSDEQLKQLHSLLAVVDPQMAEYFHFRDKRKVVNALFKFFKRGVIADQQLYERGIQKASQVDEQTCLKKGNTESSIEYLDASIKLRFLPILVQMNASQSVIEARISKRIDQMILQEQGWSEIKSVFAKLESLDMLNFDKGIGQAIGYKEFFPLYKHLKETGGLETFDPRNPGNERDKQVLKQCIAGLNIATLRYAKY